MGRREKRCFEHMAMAVGLLVFGALVGGFEIQINSQHTESRAESYWRSIRFTPYP